MPDMPNDVVKNYIAGFKGSTADALIKVTNAIVAAAPKAEVKMNYVVLAFALVHGGKREAQIMTGGYANHIGFYPHPTAIAHFENEIKGKYKYSKGSMQFKTGEDVPIKLIKEMVRYRMSLILNEKIKR